MEPTVELKMAVRGYREGKAEAFTLLYKESSRYLYTCIHGVIGRNDNAQDAICDIMQDTYVEISKNIGQLDHEERFLSWAGTIASRKCYAWLKKNKKYVLLHEADDTFENLADEEDIIPEAVMQDREKQRLVREIIDTQLTEMQKLCIIAFYYNEQKQSEIARELGIPENTVKTNLSRAKAKIKSGVLDLEEKQGTKLYSVAPFLLLLFKEEVLACAVPPSITAAVNSSVLAAGKMGIRHLLKKVAEASVKAKVTAGAVGAGVVIVAGSIAYVAMQDKAESWEKEYRRILWENDKAVGFDLNDFEEDGIPELVILEEDGAITLCSFREGEETSVSSLSAGGERGDERHVVQERNCYGYDLEYGRLINLMDVSVSVDGNPADHLTVPIYMQYLNGKRTGSEMASYGYTMGDYPVKWMYSWGDSDQYEISREEAMEHIAEAQARFNAIEYTDLTEEAIEARFKEFKENGNRERSRNENSSMGAPDNLQTQDSQAQEEPGVGEAVTLSEAEQKRIEMLAGLLTLNSYFYSEDMYGSHYPVEDVTVNMRLIDMLGALGMSNSSYVEYLPPTEADEASFTRICRAEDVQSYLKNVFGVENADISSFCQGDRVVFQMVGDPVHEEATIDNAVAMPDDAYRITGTFFLWHMEDILEVAYPYELTVTKNEESPFGFQVLSMEFGEDVTEGYGQAEGYGQNQPAPGNGSLGDILLNPEGNSAYYPREVEYGSLYFAQIDIDLDGEEEILLGTTASLDYLGKPVWMRIFNILKYDRRTGEVWDYDGGRVYEPLDADSWHYYDTGILMTMAEISYGHTYFWNLLTGEFIEADLWFPDNPERSFESEGHSRIYNADGSYITGEEGDGYYQSLKSGNEVPIVWYEALPGNVEAMMTGGNMEPAYIPTPYGRYKTNRGTELEFFEDNTVLVSEGNSSHRYAFTIDGAGNMVIDPEGEALEGTYDAQADEIRVDTLRFRR